MPFSISGKKVLITGGTAGIGLATAAHFVAQGADVVICGRRESGEEVAREIGCHFVRADMTVPAEIDELFQQTLALLGGLDVVISNAGGGLDDLITDIPLEDHDFTVALNMRSAFKVLQLAARHVTDGGAIINTASIHGMRGVAGVSSYAATKAALINLTQSAALELGARNIRVNAVSPGLINSEIWDGEAPVEKAKIVTALGRMGEAAEIATVFHFLASGAASYITGANLSVDAGVTAGTPLSLSALLEDKLLEE
ncbi:SDR family NAD(P)-dependent oxidoreductase [Aestuariispira insulae]|uniref:Meso-butanediol dehydrogenase/(S,S)-butanediol dehydrogenase/diacetyl reductase n=1 Tax=Aestuariispira insulae TaxID=1461337 RepID=A0A3D9HRH5_9PROT|nr:SDR family oxidoreductase [Aestuariispira insulae]RED52059.1 meso-butanediol dehydrogenase/(S,S)-butanediol dehydrogenase/diacetyl reductase [Aestuariispira insulae]